MSRHRLPTDILLRNGAFEHDPQRLAAREDEPKPAGPLGDPPEYFLLAERQAWTELSEQVPRGVLTIADRVLVEITSGLIARLRDRDPETARPLKAAEYNLVISCLARMGLTPADRSKIAAKPPDSEKPADTFARLAASGRGQNTEREQ
jgi:hypothetical protein